MIIIDIYNSETRVCYSINSDSAPDMVLAYLDGAAKCEASMGSTHKKNEIFRAMFHICVELSKKNTRVAEFVINCLSEEFFSFSLVAAHNLVNIVTSKRNGR